VGRSVGRSGNRSVRLPVLLVDPDGDVRAILRALLWHYGYDPLGVDEGEGALAVAHGAGPALVIAELYVPTDRYPCVVRPLKNDAAVGGTPVLVYTAHVRPADFQWARDSGCDGLLPKPSALDAVLREVRRLTAAAAGPPGAPAA
jgi:CheY-like chemotaxis protein